MRLLLLTIMLSLATNTFANSVSYLSVSSDNNYSKASDFTNTYEININEHGSKKVGKCQAVRLEKNWYITAAHCVYPSCDKACSIQVRLIVGPDYEMSVTTTHKKKAPRIFKDPKADVKNKNAAYDIALLYLKPSDSITILRHPKTLKTLTEEEFIAKLPNDNMYTRALYGNNLPTILSIDSDQNSIVNRRLSVVSIWDGQRFYLGSTRPVFYSPKLHYMHTENFGVIQGISGSGTMANTGELVGLVSATATLDYTDPKTKKDLKVNIIFIASFDKYVLDFIKNYIPEISYKEAGDAISPIPQGFQSFTQSFEKATEEIKK